MVGISSWRSWTLPNVCPVCGGHAWGGFSGESGKRCAGGYFADQPGRVACSNDARGHPSSTGRTWWHRLPEPYAWSGDAMAPTSRGRRGEDSPARPAAWPQGIPTSWTVAATYAYQWAELDGSDPAHLFDVVRFAAPPDWTEPGRRKAFRPRRPSRTPGLYWWSLFGVQRVPFRLPEWRRGVAAGLRTVLVEGEKDALTGAEHVPCAVFTTAPGGVAGFDVMVAHHQGARWFAGIHTLDVILDRDEAGDRLAAHVHQHLVVPGVVKEARYWRTPLDAPGADLTDHFNAGLALRDMRLVHLRRPDGTAL